jgi:threonyl-tRNA synthetase
MPVNYDHRIIAQALDLYIFSDEVGQGLPLLLPN